MTADLYFVGAATCIGFCDFFFNTKVTACPSCADKFHSTCTMQLLGCTVPLWSVALHVTLFCVHVRVLMLPCACDLYK
jgi:hypothetical protein